MTTLTITEDDVGQRLDRFIALQLPDLSRTYIQQLITDIHIRVNGRGAKSSYPVQAGDTLEIVLPLAKPTDIVPEDIPLDVVYEDEDVLVVNKAAGMVVHPAPGHTNGTLVNALLYRYPNLTTSGDLRPGIVHRIDKDTSGLLVVAKHDLARAFLVAQQQEHAMSKRYLALVEGHFREQSGAIDAPIARNPNNRLRMAVVSDGRYAITHYRVLEELGSYSLVRATLETGRTHQIRVHFAYKNRPVVGDVLYGPRRAKETFGLKRHFLHAYQLGFCLPSDREWHDWELPLPPELEAVLSTLRLRFGSLVIPDENAVSALDL
ncbi:MAG: RluA family pseudouridine synthase [Herpetosiphonaceae bacterium]|nr:RluA family pseudouridine synthase [Herpetosiphonaceae bacterium]